MMEFGKILLAEDDPRDVELTLEGLSEHNLANDVVVARDGEEALDYLFRRGMYEGRPEGDPVVVLLDLKMPKVDGVEVARQIKSHEETRLIPVVILTSSRESRDLDECYRLGVNAYVVKPVQFRDFIEAIRQVGGFWAVLNEPPARQKRVDGTDGTPPGPSTPTSTP
jgi:CheY-like chemotaxis protein